MSDRPHTPPDGPFVPPSSPGPHWWTPRPDLAPRLMLVSTGQGGGYVAEDLWNREGTYLFNRPVACGVWRPDSPPDG